MKIADMLNPTSQLSSPPLSPQYDQLYEEYHCNKRNSTSSMSSTESSGNGGKPRSRFSNTEDAIICQGVARGLTWGQISGQLPHRKRATCFNRYRTLQGIRKSRKRSLFMQQQQKMMRSPPVTPSPPTITSSCWSSFASPSPKQEEEEEEEQQQQQHSYYHHHHHHHHRQQQVLPVLVAPLPTRLPPLSCYNNNTSDHRLH